MLIIVILKRIRLLLYCAALIGSRASLAQEIPRTYYSAPAWQPRAILPSSDALSGTFWPASPAVHVDYDDPGFAGDRLSALPPPGVHPRVIVTPEDVDRIRAKVALGDKAPVAFRVMWERVARSRSAFYALVTKDDALGKQLAARLVANIKTLEPKLDAFDRQPDRDNLWAAERSAIASGDPNPPTEIWSLLDYDYLAGWMTPDERESARRVIARLMDHRISNFMMVPDHFMINNHQGFGMEYIRLMLLIEGEKGFDKPVFDLAARKARAMLDWDLDDDGMCYESIKGWLNIPAFVAVGLRQRDLLRHAHLRAKMRFFQAALRWEDGAWRIRDEMRASAFHVIWMMHYYHPKDPGIDLLYQSTFSTHPFLTDPDARWPAPVGTVPELLLLYADDGITGPDGKPRDWTAQDNIDQLRLPLTWQDNQRGYLDARNSWRKDDLHLGFACKQDFFYGGHEGSENGRITLWRDGVNWIQDTNMLATKATSLQNMLTVDGKGQHWPPAPGTWLGVQESPDAVSAACDGRDGYSYTKSMQVHPLDFPSARLPYYAPFAEANYDLTRDIQVAFNPRTIAWNDGYAHTDYGPWSGETRLVEGYRSFNPMEQAYRTVQMARGPYPYVLVIDDAHKDAQPHEYEWNVTVPQNAVLIDAVTPEAVFQNTEPSQSREDDLVLGLEGTPRDSKTGEYAPRKGDPLCLVRVLWRNSPYGYPPPRLEQFQGFKRIVIPAISTSPEFRVMIYAYRQGDPIPRTAWNRDRTELTVRFDSECDRYHFAQADGGRTVFSMERDAHPALSSHSPPARPVLVVRGESFDASALRYTRMDGVPPRYLVDGTAQAGLIPPPAPAEIRYTLDGSDPSDHSALYESPLDISKTCELKACVFDPAWVCGPKVSEPLVARFIVRAPAPGLAAAPLPSKPGLLARVYELKTVMWNDRGFFDAKKVMMPDLSREKPIAVAAVDGFQLPHVVPAAPQIEQRKGFYQFTGWFNAPRRGVYQFAVNSCGPVTLDVGHQAAIEWTGLFHQQQAVRKGEALLDRGWQPIELVVCDPQFWNLNTLDPMPFSVSCRFAGGEARDLAGALCFQPIPAAGPAQPAPVWHEAARGLPRLEPGVMLNIFDRSGKRRAPDFLDIDGSAPIRSEETDSIEPSANPTQARCYEGLFKAPVSGIYTFDMPMRGAESAGLGALQAACQNQLRVDGEVLVQRGIPGRMPIPRIGLKAGWHPISIRLGSSDAPGLVTYPDGSQLPLTAAALSRPVLVRILPAGHARQERGYEIYAPTPVTMSTPPGWNTDIRYTLDGRVPERSDALYTAPVTVDKDTSITARAFDAGTPVTAPACVALKRVNIPEAGLLGCVTFAAWDGSPGFLGTDAGFQVSIPPDAALAETPAGGKAIAVHQSAALGSRGGPAVDVNVSRGASAAGFRFTGIKMRENSLSVSVWFKSDGDGKLFGKDGYNAFGKSYKTVSCSIAGARLSAGPGHLFGGKVAPGRWYHVVMTGDENQLTLYLDGEQVASGPGSRDLMTDALDFFTDNPAVVSNVRLYNRVLAPADVKQLYTREKEPSRE